MSLSDWMSDADYEWRGRLQPINLVIEADFTADEVCEAQRNYGLADGICATRGFRIPRSSSARAVHHSSLGFPSAGTRTT